mmetsp:Transcript_9063/g.22325  ORF Transcript_9063/g.22325 Transcript_9063/m.22325 type:complete len:235 (-) Transcript_9063:387-1091(-)
MTSTSRRPKTRQPCARARFPPVRAMHSCAKPSAAITGYVVSVGCASNTRPMISPVQYVATLQYVNHTAPHSQPAAAMVAGMDSGTAMYMMELRVMFHVGVRPIRAPSPAPTSPHGGAKEPVWDETMPSKELPRDLSAPVPSPSLSPSLPSLRKSRSPEGDGPPRPPSMGRVSDARGLVDTSARRAAAVLSLHPASPSTIDVDRPPALGELRPCQGADAHTPQQQQQQQFQRGSK